MNSDMPAPFEHEMQHPLDHEQIPEHIRFLQTLSSAPRTPSSPVHFVTMMIKNFRQKLRTPAGTILEIILPVIFVLGLMAIWAATASGNVSDTQYVNQSMTTVPTPNTPSQVIATYICSNGTVIPTIRACTITELSSNNINCPAVPLSGRPIPVKGLCYIGNGANLLNSWLDFRRPRFIPSMDELIVMQWLTRIAISQKTRDSSYGQTLEGLSNNGMLHFTPNTPEVNNFVTYLSGVSTLFPYVQGQVFNNADTARSYVSSNANTDTAWAIVEIGAMTTSTIDVTIHMNRSGLPWTNKVIEVGNGIGSFSTGKYIAAGFITLQDLVNRYYETQILGVTTPLQLVHIPMPYRGYDTSAFLTVVGTLASLFLVFGYIYPVSQLVKRIVEEKEQKVREAMMIMGLATAPFYSSWVITYFVMQVITSLICAGILKGTMFPKSDFAIIWALYFMFGLSNITFSSILSSFFSKSRIAALVAPVIFFICAVPSFALPDTTPASTLIIISLLSPTAFANGMNVLVDQEINGGMTNATIGESFNGYPMTIVLFMLTLDTVLYFLLTLYFDAILPSEWGTHKHPCFCYCCFCSKSDHRGEHGFEGVADGRDPTGAYEAETPGLKPAVELRGLRKEFDTDAGKMVAVDNLTFNMYEGQVFCLLGHNGAGKSTAMNLMTGMLDLDAGDCYFHGNSVTHDLDLVRREIGYCPQHNILWPELTCREHLHFFARLKGLDGDMREKAVEAVLKAVDLEDKADKFSTELSGGQKRKLSVAIAFVGGSRVVFLDEPSAGMDVDARRHTWDLIKYMTPGRTIVLTTHYMEEADLLGHTIAIMSKGRLKCSGSGVFLKSRLGVGYNFTVTCAHGTNNTNHIIDAVQRYVPDASILSNAAGEVSLRLPLHAVPAFPPLLQYFENNGPAMGVRGHGISVTTLEEIFLKLGHDEEGEKEDHVPTPIVANPVDAQFQNYNSGHQIPTYTPVAVDESKGLIWTPEVANSHPTSMGQMTALFLKRFNYARRDTRTIVMQIVLPVVCILFAMLLTLIKFPDAPRLTFEPSIYPDSVGSAFAGCPANWNLYTVNSTTTVDSLGSNSLQLSQFLLDTYKKHTRHRVGSHVCADNSITSVSTSSTVSAPSAVFFTNTSIYRHSGPHAVWELHTATMRYNTQRNIVNHMSTYPFPLSARESAVIAAITTLFVALFVMIPLTFVPSTFVSFVVKERETRALQLQQASGLKFIVYWVSNYIFDLVSFLFTALLIITVFAIFGRDEYIGSGELFIATLILFIIYGFASVSSSYIMSFGFDSHSTAQNIVMLVNFICGFMLVLLAYILSIIDSTKDAGSAIKYVFRLVPSYCLGEGILNLANRQLQAGYASAPDAFDMSVLGWPLLYMAIEAPIFFAITLYIDSPLRRSQQHSLTGDATAPASIEHEDEDVLVERQEIESGQRDATDVVVVKNLRKVYHGRKDVVAVQNLSFGVHKGEVFGFLGTNGAGKTTTISILCGEHMPSYGRGWIGGFDVVSQASQARAMIGYCPQFDATHDLLTAEEHLALYAGLHGLQSPLKEQVIERLIHVCGLQEHRAKESRSLSGGNRRKLSVAISLVGAPQVVFLDEPSAGMDPMARRGLFDVIEQIARHASVILTTHHLEEVEALSNRVGIMVNGELRCIGPLQHLKTKFGSGFEMTMRVSREDRVPQAISFITGNLAQARIQEQRGGKLTVALPQNTRLSAVFQLLETNKSVLGITDYSIQQTSLESVFLRISADAKAEE